MPLPRCPGFSQDRVNFHQEPEGNTARQADPTWPNRAGYFIPCAVMLGSGWGEMVAGRTRGLVALGGSGWWELLFALCSYVLCNLLICIVVVPVPFVYCSLKLPLSQSTSFLYVSFHAPLHTSRGRGGHMALLLLAAAKL